MYRLKQILVMLGDLGSLYLGLVVAVALRAAALRGNELQSLRPAMAPLFVLAIGIMFIAGLYDLTRSKNRWNFYKKIVWSALAWTLGGMVYFYLNIHLRVAPKTILLLTGVISFIFVALWRTLTNLLLASGLFATKVIFAGITRETSELLEFIPNNPERGYEIAGLITLASSDNKLIPPNLINKIIPLTAVTQKIEREGVRLIVIAPECSGDPELLKIIYENLPQGIEILPLANFFEEITGRIPPFTFSESWFLSNLREYQKKTYDRVRLLLDYSIGLAVGAFSIITFPFIATAIKVSSRGPVFFHQARVGRSGKEFVIHKYRSMQSLGKDGSAEMQGPEYAKANDPRITAVGRLLRRTRLDELPQFWNILRGEMSLIGPRPERPTFVEELTRAMPFYTLRHLVKPGLTGWAQIHKSYYGTLDENLRKLEYDLFYIKNRGPILDLAILLRTINILARMKGR